MASRYVQEEQSQPLFETPEDQQATYQRATSPDCVGLRTLDAPCSLPFLRPKLRLCNGTLSALFVWLPDGNVENESMEHMSDSMRYALATVRRVSSTRGRHLLVLNGGLHGGRFSFQASAYLLTKPNRLRTWCLFMCAVLEI
jgi:hypothetical protein